MTLHVGPTAIDQLEPTWEKHDIQHTVSVTDSLLLQSSIFFLYQTPLFCSLSIFQTPLFCSLKHLSNPSMLLLYQKLFPLLLLSTHFQNPHLKSKPFVTIFTMTSNINYSVSTLIAGDCRIQESFCFMG